MASSSTRSLTLLLATATLLLGACSPDRGRFPSLAKRPAERAFGTAMPVTPAPTPDQSAPVPAAKDIITRVAALRQQALAANARFESQQVATARAVSAAHGAAVGSESWSVAQVALAGLDSARSQGMIAMADLDRMLVLAAQAAVDGPDSDLAAIKPAHDEVSALLAGEDKAIESLRGQVAG